MKTLIFLLISITILCSGCTEEINKTSPQTSSLSQEEQAAIAEFYDHIYSIQEEYGIGKTGFEADTTRILFAVRAGTPVQSIIPIEELREFYAKLAPQVHDIRQWSDQHNKAPQELHDRISNATTQAEIDAAIAKLKAEYPEQVVGSATIDS